jgi:hypothetical protein
LGGNAWIHSSEMDNAIKFNYKFKIIKGYQFEKGEVFKDFIETMYALRLEYPPLLKLRVIPSYELYRKTINE